MAMGVTSYSSGRRLRRRRRAAPTPPPEGPRPPLSETLARLEALLVRAWPLVRLPLTAIVVAHLVGVALYPGGRNGLFGVKAAEEAGYLSWFQVPDTLGFYTTHGTDGFLVYKIYTQDGSVVDGIFPDAGVAPKLRYDRWATAGNAASGPYPELHAYVVRYLLGQLPSPPLRLEVFSARWIWDRNSLSFPWPGQGPDTTLELRLLGNYNGLTRAWEPARQGSKRR